MLIKGKVVAKTRVVELNCPSHKVDTNLNAPSSDQHPGTHAATFELSGITTDMDRDFILLVKVDKPHEPRVFVEVSLQCS
jgi:hypothetical protein